MRRKTMAANQPVTPDGVYERMPFDEYQRIDALNGSSVIHLRRSAMHYRYERDHPSPPSPAMELGTIVHRMILEPEMVGNIAVWGEEENQKVRRGKVWDEFYEMNKNDLILTVAERDACVGMSQAALRNEPIQKYASADGRTEISLVWTDETGRRWKARLDKIIPDTHTVFDLKTTRDCHSFKFCAQAYNLGYHIKLAIYAKGYEALFGVVPNVVMGAVDSKPPHESAVYRVTRDVLLQGVDELNELLAKLDECETVGAWPPAFNEETDLLLPSWAMRNEYEDGDFVE
jgi:hypothetical protein